MSRIARLGQSNSGLKAHRHVWSPNTVRGYATALTQWWTFLEQRGEIVGWDAIGVPAVSGFLSWLRNGRTVEHSITHDTEAAPSPETLEARLAALISFYRWHGSVNAVPVADKLLRGRPRQAPARGLLSHLDARREPQPSSVVRVRTIKRSDRPPLLLPHQVQAILDGCAVYNQQEGEWQGNLRDRFLFALLAETGMFSGAQSPCAGVVL
jgi:site-specific recombinase XerD